MPNHVYSRLKISENDESNKEFNALKILKGMGSFYAVKRNNGEIEKGYRLDFNKFIPMPKELLEISSPATIVETQEEADAINKEWAKNNVTSKDDPKIRAITREEQIRRGRKYGYSENTSIFKSKEIIDWYDWSCKYWGTKWNAYDCKLTGYASYEIIIDFCTAWNSVPIIIDKMLEAFPHVNLEYLAVDEGGWATHYISRRDGVTTSVKWEKENDPSNVIRNAFELIAINYDFLEDDAEKLIEENTKEEINKLKEKKRA